MKAYQSTDQLLHLLCQTLAKVNKLVVAKKTDDSHTNLYFDPVGNRILGRWFEAENGQRLIMSLSLFSLQFECLDESLSVVLKAKTIGRTLQKTEERLAEKLKAKEILSKALPASMHYEIPTYSFADRKIRRPGTKRLQSWAHFRALANTANQNLLGFLQAKAEIRIWPHHFDTGLYFQRPSQLGIGFGLAMQDDLIDEPYFYLTGYALKGSMDYDKLPSLSRGQWLINDAFKGAMLPLKALRNRSNKKTDELLTTFVEEAALGTISAHQV